MSQNWKILAGILLVAGFGAWIFVSLGGNNKSDSGNDGAQNQQQAENGISLTELQVMVPIYSPADLNSVLDGETDQGKSYTISLLTEDSVADVNMWYRGALSSGGWHITGDNNVGGYVILKGEKDNYFTTMQAANTEDGEVKISQQIKIRK